MTTQYSTYLNSPEKKPTMELTQRIDAVQKSPVSATGWENTDLTISNGQTVDENWFLKMKKEEMRQQRFIEQRTETVQKSLVSATDWEDTNLTISNLENEHWLLKKKREELKRQKDPKRAWKPEEIQSVEELERQARLLEKYASELEERRGLLPEHQLRAEEETFQDLVHKFNFLKPDDDRLRREHTTKKFENEELRKELIQLQKYVEEAQGDRDRHQQKRRVAEERREGLEKERDRIRRELKQLAEDEVILKRRIEDLKIRADLAERELAAVYKWWEKKKCKCQCCKKNKEEPWKNPKYMEP